MVVIRFTQAARKHKIGRQRARYVIAHPVAKFIVPVTEEGQDERTLYLGDDHTGRALEIMTVPNREGPGLLVIHAMDLRPKYQQAYERAKQEGHDDNL